MATSRLSVDWDGGHQELSGDRPMVIGRGDHHEVRIADARVSWDHCELRPCEQGWVLVDTDSLNGTWIGGVRRGEYVLPAGERVQVALGGADGPVLSLHVQTPGHLAARPGSAKVHGATQTVAASASGASSISIGRAGNNDVVIDDPLVSRQHAVVEMLPDAAVLRDLDSFNGTFVNSRRLEGPTPLRPNDVVGVGAVHLRWDGSGLLRVSSVETSGFSVDSLSVGTRSGKVLLDDVSLSLPSSSLTAVIGPSGAGKSTLLGAMTGLRPATEGTVRWLGRDLYAEYEQLRLHLGFVPQEDIQHPQLRVGDALRYAAQLRLPPDTTREEIRRRVDEVTRQMQLEDRLDQRVGPGLSGGQRKRVSIAMELLTAPAVLFLDEPTSGLDPGLDIKIMTELLRGLADDGRIVLVVTHSVLALEACDLIVVMAEGGRLAYFGPPGDLLRFFGVTAYPDVFRALEESDWPEKYSQSTARRRFVRRSSPTPSTAPVHTRTLPAGLRQFRTLVARLMAVIGADRNFLALLLVMPAVLALLARVVPGEGGLSVLRQSSPEEVSQRLVVLILGASLMGGALSVRELVKERAILAREHAVGLSIPAYVASKVAVLGVLSIVQSIAFVYLAVLGKPGPDGGGVLGLGMAEIAMPVAAVGFATVLAGLLVSALVSSNEQTMPMLVGLVMLQLVLCGGLIPLADRAGLEQAAYLVPGRFGFGAAASAVGLQPDVASGVADDPMFDHTAEQWFLNMSGVLLLCVVLAVVLLWATGYSIRRRSGR